MGLKRVLEHFQLPIRDKSIYFDSKALFTYFKCEVRHKIQKGSFPALESSIYVGIHCSRMKRKDANFGSWNGTK